MYFDVAGCDKTIAKVKALGGQVHMAPMSMEKVGRFAVLADAQGAVFAIVQSAERAEEKKPAAKETRGARHQAGRTRETHGEDTVQGLDAFRRS